MYNGSLGRNLRKHLGRIYYGNLGTNLGKIYYGSLGKILSNIYYENLGKNFVRLTTGILAS